jgi:hypothetical protein
MGKCAYKAACYAGAAGGYLTVESVNLSGSNQLKAVIPL